LIDAVLLGLAINLILISCLGLIWWLHLVRGTGRRAKLHWGLSSLAWLAKCFLPLWSNFLLNFAL
jgi:hypothetical protein